MKKLLKPVNNVNGIDSGDNEEIDILKSNIKIMTRCRNFDESNFNESSGNFEAEGGEERGGFFMGDGPGPGGIGGGAEDIQCATQ